MLFGDNVYVGSTAVDKIYLGDTEVWSAIPADVKAHIARVIADGGTVPEQAKMVSMVKQLMANNLWDNCVFFGLPLGGVKKDGNQFVSKVYDLKGNADLLQGTGTAQPKYQSDGSLLFDGGDLLLSTTISTLNPIRTITTNMSVSLWMNIKSTTFDQAIFGRWGTGTSANSDWLIYIPASGLLSVYIAGVSATSKFFRTTVSMVNRGLTHFAFTYNGNAMDGSVNGVLKLYINGVEHSPTKTTNNNSTTLYSNDKQLQISGFNTMLNNPINNGGYVSLLQAYNSTLTAEQILWNYNNIRPEGV